ncbi:MAG: flavodoxin domain-containing protein [Thermodesulfobacteriota bacterium]
MARALIVYATHKGQTRNMAEIIGEGLRLAGVEAEVADVQRIRKPEDLVGYDAYVFGSATYHGDMMQPMKQMLFLADQALLEGKVGGAFGAFGWSGEAPNRIFDTMRHIFKMDMVDGPLRLKSVALQGGLQAAQEYGKKIAAKLGA